MLYKGVLITQASGRLGDSVWSRNRGGPYVRALGNPNPNPPTDPQVWARQAYANVIAYWQGLTDAQRQAWRDLSTDAPLTSRIGVRRPCGGLGMFTRANFPRAYQNISPGTDGLDIIQDPPAVATRPFPSAIVLDMSATAGTAKVTVTLDDTSPLWVGQAGMLVYVGNSLTPSRRYYRSPMSLRLFLSFDTVSTDLALTRDSVAMAAGDHCWVKLQWTFADGAISLPRWTDVVAV